jgi:hypothetical protein
MTLKQFIVLLIAYAVGFLALIVSLYGFGPVWRVVFWKNKKKKSPIKDNLLTYPGMSLVNNIDNEMLNSLPAVVLLMFAPALSLFVYGAIVGKAATDLSFFIFVILALVATGAGSLKLRKRFRQIRDWRFGLDAERAVGEELNQLMRYGFYVFHDLQAGTFNIDHVIIGPSGVFAVETKARVKMVGKGDEGAKVFLNGKTLKFPNGLDKKSILQAEGEAKWLSDFLRKSIGKGIPVQAVLALPGWFIERGPHDGTVLVINPKNPEKFFNKRKSILDDQTIQQVVYQVEQRCRTVQPFDPF